MTALVVTNVDPVNLDGFVDGSNNLQVKYGSTSLAGYDNMLNAVHENLDSPSGTIRIKLVDFTHGGATWTMTASHDEGSANWTRGSGHAYYDFGALTAYADVEVHATSDSSPPTTKIIFIKVLPEGSK
jgi:hypothetical protein